MKVLVLGWFNSGNTGDDLFTFAFQKLFPDIEFRFTSQLTEGNLADVETVIIGGGSILFKDIQASPAAVAALKTKKLLYVSVGAETNISPMHTELLKLAKLVAIRSNDLDKVKALNPNTIKIPDLVYALQDEVVSSPKLTKSVLVLPNIEVVPNHGDEHWKHASFDYFKSEFAQFLDVLASQGHRLNFFTMCQNDTMSDSWAASNIIGMMKKRSTGYQLSYVAGNIATLTSIMSKYSCIITQRYHGIILAEMMKIPYIAIHHHDKLKFATPMNGNLTSYYGMMKSNLLDNFNNLSQVSGVSPNFADLVLQVNNVVYAS